MERLVRVSSRRVSWSIALLLFSTTIALAHDGHEEKQDSTSQMSTDTIQQHLSEKTAAADFEVSAAHQHTEHEKKVTADLADFPSLHPLIVHFAIVLLIIGALLQLLNIYFLKIEIAWIAFALVAGGVVAAYLAGGPFHPHTHGLTEHAQLVLDQHDYWAAWTINLGIFGAILQGINLFFLSRKRWAVTLIAFLLIGAGYAVSRAGHYGSQLVHIEGVGPQGDFLETGDSHSH